MGSPLYSSQHEKDGRVDGINSVHLSIFDLINNTDKNRGRDET